MKPNKTEELLAHGRQLMDGGDFQGAAQDFAACLEEEDTITARNNLAISLFMGGQAERALEILEPAWNAAEEDRRANPFTYATAARCCAALGRKEEARQWLNEAIQNFDKGLEGFSRLLLQPPIFYREYTVSIMRAAADVSDDREVFELYRRWESEHVSWENRHMAAVACFNLGRYKRAAGLWSSIAQVNRSFADMQRVAFLAERGAIPPFTMGYGAYTPEEVQAIVKSIAYDKEARRRYFQDGYVLMILLSYILNERREEKKMAEMVTRSLIVYGGEWGKELGQRILTSPSYSLEAKMRAAQALVELGVLKEEEPVEILVDGEKHVVEFKRTELVFGPDKEQDAIVDKAYELQRKGFTEAGIELLRGLQQKDRITFRAMMALANLLRSKKRLDEALEIMSFLEELAPKDPVVLFNYAALLLQMGKKDEARSYLGKIDRKGLGEDFLKKLKWLEIQLEEFIPSIRAVEEAVALQQEEARRRIEEKPLPVDPSCRRGLKNMPANWLDAACFEYDLEPARLRSERERQLAEHLSSRDNMRRIVAELDQEEQGLLNFLLEKGGWSRLNVVTRKFGPLQGDGFSWEELGPKSLLGRLWLKGLVMVGKANLAGRQARISTIPVELRPLLREIFTN
ncbi:MAG: tetratricopeptide repeat protein [Firmicutes bacterium]|nr:tetratricopeptide repeat protein [Bacillota bacterium]MCL5040019.1 tetratricopeptide repeat protein [Bacillota bacterium]